MNGIIGGVLWCQQVYSQPSMVQYIRQYTRWYRYHQTQLLEDNGYLYRTKGCAPNRLTQFTARQLIATPDIGGFTQMERLLLMVLDTTMNS